MTAIRSRLVLLLLLLVAAGFAVTACSGSPAKASDAAAVGATGATVDSSGLGARDLVPGAAAVPVAGSSAAVGVNSSAGSAAASAPAVAVPAVVRTATLQVRVVRVETAADASEAIATTAGGRVDGDTRSDVPGQAQAVVILRVPATGFEAALAAVDKLGVEQSRNVTGTDVTATRADTDARVAAAATSVDRLQALLSGSGSLTDLLAIETQLTQRQSDLESLQAQQRALADQIALATVSVTFVSPTSSATAVAGSTGPRGFGSALGRGWHGLVVGLRWLLAGLGYALPVAIPLLVLLLIGFRIWWRGAGSTSKSPLASDMALGSDTALGSDE